MIRGVLFDIGDTLVTPRGGRWNPRFDFEATLAEVGIQYETDRLPVAIAAGKEYLDRTNVKGNRDDYHREVLRVMGVEPDPGLLLALDRPVPFDQIVEVFPDVPDALATLAAWGLALGVVSDTGSEARRTYQAMSWGRHVTAWAISAEVGCCKPDPLMYRTASDALGLTPDECLFIDDSLDCLLGALSLGYHVCGISRYDDPPQDGLTWIRDLGGLLDYLKRNRGHA